MKKSVIPKPLGGCEQVTLVVFKMDSNSFVALLHHVISKFD